LKSSGISPFPPLSQELREREGDDDIKWIIV